MFLLIPCNLQIYGFSFLVIVVLEKLAETPGPGQFTTVIMIEMIPLLGSDGAGRQEFRPTSSGSCSSFESLDYYTDEEKPVLTSCCHGDYLSLSYFLARRGNPNECDSKGKTGLHWAAARGRDDILQKLLENNADLKIIDYMGNTALHYCGHPETINCLVNFGADISVK